MGNPDLVVIINHISTFIVKGKEYDGEYYKGAIDIAVKRYIEQAKEILKTADKPEELNFSIRKIEIYELYEEV